MKLLIVVLWFMCATTLMAQKIEEQPKTLPSSLLGLSMSGHSYPVSLNGDIHKSFLVVYGISTNTKVELQGFYDTYLLTERFRTNFGGKYYLNEQLYVFSGMEMERATGNFIRLPVPDSYRVGVVAGAGYDVSENFMIEIKSNIQVNNATIGLYGESLIKMPAVYTIGSKLKF